MSFSVIALLGLLPLSLTQLTSSDDQSRARTISQQVITEARQTNFTTLSQSQTYNRYFTNDGSLTNASDPTANYAATVVVTSGGSGAVKAVPFLPSQTLVTLTVQIYKAPGGHLLTQTSVANFVSMLACNDLSAFTAGSTN